MRYIGCANIGKVVIIDSVRGATHGKETETQLQIFAISQEAMVFERNDTVH